MSFSVSTQPLEDRQLAVTIQVDQERVDRELRKAANKVAARYRFPGFRKGKAPYHIVVQQFGLANLYSEFVENLGQELFQKAIEQEGIEPYAQSSLEDIQLEPLTYKLIVPLEPQVTLGDYRSLRLEEVTPTVDDAEVERQLESYREQYASWQDVERPSQYGDMMTIDVKSVIAPAEEGGEETVVLDETDWDVTPDQENPMEPPGFDEKLVGLKPGETVEFDLSWPAEGQSIYAGKQAHFTVTVKSIQAYQKPELNDDFAKLVGPDFETLEDLKRNIRESAEAGEKSRLENEFVTQALDAVIEMSTLDYPPVMIEDQINSMLQDTEQRLRQLGIDSLDTFLRQTNQTLEDYREMLRPEATKIARRNLVISELVKAENLRISDEEVEQRIKAFVGDVTGEASGNAGSESESEGEEAGAGEDAGEAEEARQSANALANMLRQGAGRNMIVSQLLVDKALDRLTRIVRGETIEDEPVESSAEASALETGAPETGALEAGAAPVAESVDTPSARTEE